MSEETHAVEELAYLLWERRGRPEGTAEKDWLEAERQLSAPKVAAASSEALCEIQDRRREATGDTRAEGKVNRGAAV